MGSTKRDSGVGAVAIAAALLTGGCLADVAVGREASGVPHHEPPPAFRVQDDVSGCLDAPLLLPVETGHAQGLLPPGYAAGDAAEFLATFASAPRPAPGAVPRGLVILDAIRCAEGSTEAGGPADLAGTYVFIRPPDLGPGHPTDDGHLHLYVLAQFTSSRGRLALLSGLGFPIFPATVEPSIAPLPAAPPSGHARVDDSDGEVYAFDFQGTAGPPQAFPLRIVHQLPGGVVLQTVDVRATASSLGPATACALRAGSVPARAAGLAACSPGDAIVGANLDESWTGTLEWLPGLAVQATAAAP